MNKYLALVIIVLIVCVTIILYSIIECYIRTNDNYNVSCNLVFEKQVSADKVLSDIAERIDKIEKHLRMYR